MSLEIDLELKEGMKDIGYKLNQAFANFYREILDRILKYSLENIVNNKSVVSSILLKSGRVEFDKQVMEGIVAFQAPYAVFVEFGTRPHTPPLGPSLPHKVISRGKQKGEIRITSTPDPSTNPLDYWSWRKGSRTGVQTKYGIHTSLGYAVWLKIRREGTSPHPYIRPAIDKVTKEIPEIAAKHGLEFER